MLDFTVSWLRAYHAGIDPRTDLPSEDREGDLDLLDIRGHAVYDVQTIQHRHVTQARAAPIPVKIPCAGGAVAFDGLAHPFLLFHISGFMVVRLTIPSWTLAAFPTPTPELLRDLHRRLWQYDFDIEVGLPSGTKTMNLRSALNLVWVQAFGAVRGLADIIDDPWRFAVEDRSGAQAIRKLYDAGAIAFPYPVIAGTHYEWSRPDEDSPTAAPSETWINRLMSLPGETTGAVPDLALASQDLWWFAREMQSAVVVRPRPAVEELASLEPHRMQLAEFFALRRGALRSLQRQTQLVLAEGRGVSTGQIAEWRRILAAVCDDYVLHDDTGPLVSTLSDHFREDEHVRDPEPLREQVARNIDAFQERIDVAGQRAGIVLGVLFGVVAALSLSPIAKQLLAIGLGLEPATADRFGARYPGWSVAVDVAVVILLGTIALALFRRASSRLPSGYRASRAQRPTHAG